MYYLLPQYYASHESRGSLPSVTIGRGLLVRHHDNDQGERRRERSNLQHYSRRVCNVDEVTSQLSTLSTSLHEVISYSCIMIPKYPTVSIGAMSAQHRHATMWWLCAEDSWQGHINSRMSSASMCNSTGRAAWCAAPGQIRGCYAGNELDGKVAIRQHTCAKVTLGKLHLTYSPYVACIRSSKLCKCVRQPTCIQYVIF